MVMLMGSTAHAQFYHFDVNNDGEIELTDALLIINYILGRFNPGDNQPQFYLTCPDDHHPHMIDLGLPSGTKWACCNVGTDKPEGYGGYFSWGETEEKEEYDERTYKYYEVGYEVLGNNIAGTQHDVARVKWGGTWCMPSRNQLYELLNNCSSEWTTLNGVSGRIFTGKNGGTIFFPAAGYSHWGNIDGVEREGCYWSSMLDTGQIDNHKPFTAPLSFYFGSDYQEGCLNFDGTHGFSVRPVDTNTFGAHLLLSESKFNMFSGEKCQADITSGNGNYSVVSSDENVVIATIDGNTVKFTAIGAGSATITVKDTRNKTASISVMVSTLCPDNQHPHVIDLGLPSGTKWACCNVDTDHPSNQRPTNYGGYYAWGETETKDIYDSSTYKNSSIGSDIAGTEYDVAHVKWGNDWRMPSAAQANELWDWGCCSSRSATINGVKGMIFTGNNGCSIFLPAAGARFDGGDWLVPGRVSENGYYGVGTDGYYWTSQANPNLSMGEVDSFYFLGAYPGGIEGYNGVHFYGQSVRPVVSK